ncbi:hypothetical protein H5410_016606 [Solanum commersonii]|uniref:Uncharacterized protein n=1 Tax=Solanum commersonii TaxID=4109 RepID=A0A9J5ZWU2_SOLCO|nr:hypothetical protein H5410_016606 [Solanum commersonii]
MDDAPLFSNGIAQIMSSNTNRVYDYEKINWAENRSKKLHNPFVMAKVNIKKVKKDSQSSSKAQSIKPQKRGVEKSHQQFLGILYLSILAGASARLVFCYNGKSAIVQSAIIDKNIEFWITPKLLIGADISKCKVYLVKSPSPTCNVSTNFNGGRTASKYGLDKVKAGYVSDNDDPPRLKSVLLQQQKMNLLM